MSWIKKNIVLVMFGGVIILFLLNFSMIFFVSEENTRGTFGDQFGAVNALFSGMAFAGLIYTIILQRRDLEIQRHDLKLQREEIALNRQEMKEQTAEFEKQNKTLSIQRFENTFFNMLSQFQEVVNNLKVTKHFYNGEGRDSFERAYVKNEQIEQNMNDFNYYSMQTIIYRDGVNGYKRSDLPKYFDHYFRLLYRILKYVDESKLITEFDEKYEYTSMLRAMLSRYELVWLYYNGLSPYGEEKLKPLIERYAMLKNLRDELLVKGGSKGFGKYEESAYVKTKPA